MVNLPNQRLKVDGQKVHLKNVEGQKPTDKKARNVDHQNVDLSKYEKLNYYHFLKSKFRSVIYLKINES